MTLSVGITGATGFVGGHLVREAATAGLAPVALVRRPDAANELPAEARAADLTDVAGLTQALRGCDALVANAALSPGHATYDEAAFLEANVTGARHHLEAARDAGVGHIVWISTVAVYRTQVWSVPAEDGVRLPLSRPVRDLNNFTTDASYARSKAVAEALAWSFCHTHGIALTVLRPGPVYGPGDHKLTARYAAQLARPMTFAPTIRVCHVHAGDVGRAVVASLTSDVARNRAYNLAGEWISPFRLLRTWRAGLGSRRPIVPVPVPLRIGFDDAAVRRDLGWRPRTVAEATPELCRWYFDARGRMRDR